MPTDKIQSAPDPASPSPDKQSRHPTPSPATEKVSGAGPAISERSKDAKAPKSGRQPGAYVKDQT
ncbi:hypothetical protein EN829_032570 [Mesorhizobium sp. M00.F.Ca.ET.186.01.1.1]|nr:hypothetical protein EN848_32445 [bacterium M00.F.Ca.ET.205.01.1.1]TGU46046.1 hypothetical protein EN795_33120 [bacterium M00.F.Ca.ET.152.01.1.1]TGV31518.1 hypothetical protein EN829_032570 [Mesorhizobium sp. M00.F.Ca.ET.186.01.1.1]TGZ38722.1 hypothetical protein EN805_32390 [bacterium M00.F.Ca.ET.162.01.1.1]